MNVIQIAELCHNVNRVYCLQIGDDSQPEWKEAPDWQRESAIDGVQKIVAGLRKGIHVSAWDSHNSWLEHKIKDGWKHGETKDPEAKTHPNLLPFDKLLQQAPN